jgi:hypothetical protein
MLNKIKQQLTYANVMASVAVFLALGGAAYAALGRNSVRARQIAPNAVRSSEIKADAAKAAEIAANAVGASEVADPSFTTITSFLNSWDAGSCGRPPGFTKDPEGFVHLRGAVDGGTLGVDAFTLPSGFRPATDKLFLTPSGIGAVTTLLVGPDGGTSPNGGSTLCASLDGVSFPAGG